MPVQPVGRSLQAKLLATIIGLMGMLVFFSVVAFVASTMLTQERLLNQQITAEAERVTAALQARAETVSMAATLLAQDPTVHEAITRTTGTALNTLNQRAVVVRDRFELDLIQIYDRIGRQRTNLVTSSLYRESALSDQVATGVAHVIVVDGRMLLVSRAPLPAAGGTVIVGLDLENELYRLVSGYRLRSALGLQRGADQVGTQAELPFEQPDGRSRNQYRRQVPLTLGVTPVTLLLVCPTSDLVQVTSTGLLVMMGSLLLITLILAGLSVQLTRAIARPIQQLSELAAALAQGDWQSPRSLPDWGHSFLRIGQDDEIGVLAATFNQMVTDLRALYGNLEAQVAQRTRHLTLSATVAQAVSSSLELDTILQAALTPIQTYPGFDHVAVYLVDPSLQTLTLTAAAGHLAPELQALGMQLAVGQRSLVGLVASSVEPVIVQDVQVTPEYYQEVAPLLNIGAEAAFPLAVGDKVIGVLDIQSLTPGVFTPEVTGLLTGLADQLAAGIHNAQLYQWQRQTAEHLAELDKMKNQFLANMSHELRTPLNSIIGFSKLLLKGVDGELTEDQRRDLLIIQESGQHLLRLINDVLDLSKINAGKLQLTYEMVELPFLIQEVVSAATALLQDKSVRLIVELPEQLPIIEADARRLRQILFNLLSNAIKFTERGKITVAVQPIQSLSPYTDLTAELIQIRVSDTGIGIPAERMADIFQEFTQVDGSSTRRFGGAGLGLPITRRLVELHGGDIWVDSRLGVGSTFTIILPVRAGTKVQRDQILNLAGGTLYVA